VRAKASSHDLVGRRRKSQSGRSAPRPRAVPLLHTGSTPDGKHTGYHSGREAPIGGGGVLQGHAGLKVDLLLR
jgi:hypothetical protein